MIQTKYNLLLIKQNLVKLKQYFDDKKYKITSPIVVKQGVKLLFGYGTQFVVEGNFRVLELEKNASIEGAYIAIDDPTFNSEVIYLDGKISIIILGTKQE